MGVFKRGDSAYWWIYLETTKRKERTSILVGTTPAQRYDSKRLAHELYHQRMNQLAARLYRLPTAQPAIRFDKYATIYQTDTIPRHRGFRRELEIAKTLVAFFGNDLLAAIDQDRVKSFHTARSVKASNRTINREVGLLKSMLRDAVPKYLHASPLVGMKLLAHAKPKRRLMTVAEETKLLAVCDPTERALLVLGVDGLIRLGDLLDLKRSDRQRGWLYVADPKSGDPYEVALTPRMAKALDAVPNVGAYYFARFRVAKNPRDWPGAVRQRLERLCLAAGLPYGRKKDGLTFHWATRRTGATRYIVKKKQAIPAIQRQGNWKKPNVLLEIYAEADRRDQQKAVGAFPRRSRNKRKTA